MARDWRLLTPVPVAAVLGLACALSTGVLAAGKAADDKGAAAEQAEAAPSPPGAPTPSKKKHDPAEAQRTVDNAAKLLEAGKTEQAVQVLSAALAGGNLPPAIMAKALLYRGIAYRQQKKPAQAISDFTSALWLKGGLSENERADGLRQRAAAYQEAGLSQGGEVSQASLTKETRSKERAGGSPTAPWSDGTTTSAPPATTAALNQEHSKEPSSGGGWDLFGNLFGGGTAFAGASAQPAASPPDAAQILNAETSTAERAPPSRRAQASAWSRQTQVEGEKTARVETGAIPSKSEKAAHVEMAAISSKSEPAKKQASLSEPGKSGGHLRIQIAAVRTQAEAKALAARVVHEHAATLAAREPQIEQTVMGNMGSFYRVLIGPFASAQETQNVCAKLKGSGLDCLVMAQ
jgi:cell division septation protein DedD